MKILTHEELSDSIDIQVQLLQLGANWDIFDFNRIKHARKIGYPSTNYFAVYAVEDGELLAKVEVIHIDFETPKGPEIMCGIGGVVTKRDKSRLGLARRLLLDVHEREKKSGIKHSLLWTGRNNKAHNLYESLGYVDIYDPGGALRKTQRNNISNSEDFKIRKARTGDAELMDNLHAKINSKRLGFRRRAKNFMTIVFKLGFRKPESFRIFLSNNTPVGYAYFEQNTGWIKSSEVIIEPRYSGRALSLLESEAKGNWLAFGNSFVSDARSLLTKRGYAFSDFTYSTLMVCDLERSSVQKDTDVLLGTSDHRFVCHGLDHF